MSPLLRTLALAAAVILPAPIALAEAPPPRVVASIAPLKALADAVLNGVGEATLLVPPGASPHGFALRPSDARALNAAEVVVWVGPGLEGFLPRLLDTLPAGTTSLPLSEAAGIRLLPLRTDPLWEHDHDHDHEHDHDHKHDDHGDEHDEHDEHEPGKAADLHLWLDPANGRAMLDALSTALAARDPARADTYRANAAAAAAAIAQAEAALVARLAPVRGKAYVVAHDAYQYFETRFALSPAGAVALDPGQPLGARHLKALRARIQDSGAVCLFAEPQFAPATLNALAGETGLRVGVLDPLAVGEGAPASRYADGLTRLGETLAACLEGGG